MPLLDINGARYHVAQVGDGLPLLLLHGFTGSGRSWQPLLGHLSHHFLVITVDLPGHGLSVMPDDPGRFTIPSIAADIDLLLREIGCTQTAVLGYSMGGRLALYLAAHYPDRFHRVILESASPGLKTQTEREARQAADEKLAARIEALGIRSFVEDWERLPLFSTQRDRLSPEAQHRLRQGRLRNDPAGLAKNLRQMGTGVQPSLWPALGTITQPVLLIAGRDDVKFMHIAEEMASAMPQATMAAVTGAGHTVHLEQPDTYVEWVIGWLSEQSRNELAGAEQTYKNQGGQRHLLEPRVEGRQVLRTRDGQAITNKQGHGQQKEQIPDRGERQDDVDQSKQNGACQE